MEPNGYQFPQIVISSGEKGFGRMGMLLASFCPAKGRFGRMGALQQTAPETKHKVNCPKKIVSSLQDYPTDPRRYLKMI